MAMNLPSQRGRNRRTPMAEINVTPMVDVMLVLLIIFMVTAPLLSSGVPVELPDSRAKGLEQVKDPIQISLDAAGGIYFGDEPIAKDALPARLEAVSEQSGNGEQPQIYLRADKALEYGLVMGVMGELNRAGLNKVSLVTTQGGEAQ